jgi:hypothetical protein
MTHVPQKKNMTHVQPIKNQGAFTDIPFEEKQIWAHGNICFWINKEKLD